MNLEPGWELTRQFGTALLIGALVGIDREKRKAEGESTMGGIRTFVLIALSGATAALVTRVLDAPGVFIAVLVMGALAVLVAYAADRLRPNGGFGLTTEFAAVMVFLLGGLCLLDYAGLAVALGIATSAVLAFKQPIHAVIQKVDLEDFYAGLKLLIASFIILPLLPREAVDPWGALVPYKLWLLVILISSMSLVGYVATRWLGSARGVVVTGITGGLVSSTAVTLALARRSGEATTPPAQSGTLAAGILIAWFVMVVRVEVLLFVTNPELARRALLSLAIVGAATGAAAAWVLFMNRRRPTGAPAGGVALELRNPFSLTSAIKFAALFAVVLLLVRLAQQYPLAGGVQIVAVLAGATDVDAISLSMADYARQTGNLDAAARAVVLAAASNTLVKGGLTLALGRGLMRRQMLIATTAILAASALAWFLI
jgi:uncharacterized membrane protein (DUF4010 family)